MLNWLPKKQAFFFVLFSLFFLFLFFVLIVPSIFPLCFFFHFLLFLSKSAYFQLHCPLASRCLFGLFSPLGILQTKPHSASHSLWHGRKTWVCLGRFFNFWWFVGTTFNRKNGTMGYFLFFFGPLSTPKKTVLFCTIVTKASWLFAQCLHFYSLAIISFQKVCYFYSFSIISS